MGLLRTLVRRELAENLSSSRYVLTSILCVALCFTSISLMSHDYESRVARSSLGHSVSGVSNMIEGERVSPTIVKPPEPLSLIARGLDETMGRTLVMSESLPANHVAAEVFNYYGEEHHLFDLFTAPDLVYTIGIVLSAFAIFLSFDAICGEKETHTLSLLLSRPLRRGTLLLAKWLGGYVSFLLSLFPALVLMLIYLTVFSGVPLRAEHGIRLMGIIGLSLIYLSVFFTLGLFISTITHRSATALVLAFFIWALWALGLPKAGISIARAMKPVRAAYVLGQDKHQVKQEKHLAEVVEALWKLDDAYITRIDSQIELGQHLSRFSPLASYTYASITLAKTGLPDMRYYRQRVSQWYRDKVRVMVRLYLNKKTDIWEYYHSANGYSSDHDSYVHQTLSWGQSFSRIAMDPILLMLWNVLLFLGANAAFLRYDVR